jgi:hypothetical protein
MSLVFIALGLAVAAHGQLLGSLVSPRYADRQQRNRTLLDVELSPSRYPYALPFPTPSRLFPCSYVSTFVWPSSIVRRRSSLSLPSESLPDSLGSSAHAVSQSSLSLSPIRDPSFCLFADFRRLPPCSVSAASAFPLQFPAAGRRPPRIPVRMRVCPYQPRYWRSHVLLSLSYFRQFARSATDAPRFRTASLAPCLRLGGAYVGPCTTQGPSA